MPRRFQQPAAVFTRCLIVLVVLSPAVGAESVRLPEVSAGVAGFRGPDGSGVYPEKGLLEAWPEGGPKELWFTEVLGEGFASATVAGGRIYTTGMSEQKGSLYAFDLAGKLLWQREYGAAHSGSGFPGTRTTPTVEGDTVYLLSSMGKAAAFDAASGELRWEVDVLETFGGSNVYFGVSESPLIVDDKVIFTPGGKDASVVALDKATGKTVWASKGLSESSAYCTPRLYENGGERQIVTFVAKHLVGIDPAKGDVLWRWGSKVEYDIHATSPVFYKNMIYVSHGYDQGGHLLELVDETCPKSGENDGEAEDCSPIREKWSDDNLDVHHGGVVVVDGRIYGAASGKTWYCLDGETGKVEASIRRLGKGSVIYADGMLYGYMEDGKVLLVNPDPSDFRAVSSFKIGRGSGHHWAHPTLADGVLYIRHGEALMAFDVKGGS